MHGARLTRVSGETTLVLCNTTYESTSELKLLIVVIANPGFVMLRKNRNVPSGNCVVRV